MQEEYDSVITQYRSELDEYAKAKPQGNPFSNEKKYMENLGQYHEANVELQKQIDAMKLEAQAQQHVFYKQMQDQAALTQQTIAAMQKKIDEQANSAKLAETYMQTAEDEKVKMRIAYDTELRAAELARSDYNDLSSALGAY